MYNFNNKSKFGLGDFLAQSFFDVVSETEPFLKKEGSIENLLKSKKKLHSSEQLKTVRFCALTLELYNCASRYSETNSSKAINPYTELFFSSNFNQDQFDDFIKKFKLEVVFTAHPTEVFTLPIMKNIHRIDSYIESLSKGGSPERTHRVMQGLQAELTNLWLTDEIYREKPTPEDEADRLFYIFDTSLWKSSPYFFKRFYFEYKKNYHISPKNYPNIQFSSWVGGDRDGNPFVTYDSTIKIITKGRRKVLNLILLELYTLREKTLIKTKQKELISLFPDAVYPYQALFIDLIKAIKFTLDKKATNDVVDLNSFLIQRLELAYDLLQKDGAKRIADRRLRSLIDRIKTFTLSPFKLDLRQDSEVHTEILDELKKITGKSKITAKDIKNIPLKKLSPLAQDFFQTLTLVKNVKPRPFNCYIISMARSASDIQTLQTLLSAAGIKDLPIVPLFETPDDIRASHSILKECEQKNLNLTQVMWGYSDSTKRGGRLSSAWNLYKTQEKVLKDFPYLTHFHGRGGSIARGGGDLESIFGMTPSGLVRNHFRQTFQGEVIQDQFGHFTRTIGSLENLLKECALNHFAKPISISKKQSQTLDTLAESSENRFRNLFYRDEKISEAFEKHSPISVINSMNLGSRPAKRASKKKGVSYRAIPWVFSWSQTRGFLPVWFGLQGSEKKLIDLSEDFLFLKYFLKLIKDGLTLSSTPVFKKYFKDYKSSIPKELEETKKSFKLPSLHRAKLQIKICDFLHDQQLHLLKNSKKSEIESDIEKVAAQGIATFLGKSG